MESNSNSNNTDIELNNINDNSNLSINNNNNGTRVISRNNSTTPKITENYHTTVGENVEPEKEKQLTWNEKFKKILGLDELRSKKMYQGVIIEFIGTIIYVFISVSIVVSCVNYYVYSADYNANSPLQVILNTPDSVISPKLTITVALAHIIVLGLMILTTTPHSGGHLNPTFTIASCLTGFTPVFRTIFYVFAQLTGSIIGSALVKSMLPDFISERSVLGACLYGNSMTTSGVIVGEFLFTSFNLFVAFNMGSGYSKLVPPFIISSTLAVSFVGAQGLINNYFGPGVNIARCFGPAVVMHDLSSFWVFVVGPLMACVFISLVNHIVPPHSDYK
ncbi:hypothetical protein CYY_001295 [Polysphondylium violaceum]|uniref:Aquaporin-like protein n=1 Tax=Polysphondylium violaceum TaxID=133409 RepID=A0A8J4Q3A9_9MYCE|nr:hypothetical protein CYY_001295 [Polysphondylium violaceum]